MATSSKSLICRGAKDLGLIFPLTEGEQLWGDGLRGLLYGVGLVYFFLGVAIVADIFMGSIERVTSKLVQKRNYLEQRFHTWTMWNDTVATLTLMALGSSAPEIFLAVIDVVKKKFHFGDLGPSTIVGSAAFNLLVIIAVCIVVIPTGEIRLIANRPAFYVTAAFSFGAYLWMAATLVQITPEVVDVWEGIITAAMLPVLVVTAYWTDKGNFDCFFAKLGLVDVEPEESADDPYAGAQVPTYIKFEAAHVVVPSSPEESKVELAVVRVGDCSGKVTVNYRSGTISAEADFDFNAVEGELEFESGIAAQKIEIEIPPRMVWRTGCKFVVFLEEIAGNAEFDPDDDGGDEAAIATLEIEPPEDGAGFKGIVDRFVGLQMLRAGFIEWGEQWINVFYANGSKEEQAEASKTDWFLHLLSLPWKLLFSVIPPTRFFGGWLTFYFSLGGIAGITAGVSDLAELFGCVLDWPDIVTAVTFVALGTSMPDLFASLSAAKEDPTADASIVNVTGSNSVNVFLGLGVPWTVAAVYWEFFGDYDEWAIRYPELALKYPSKPMFVVQAQNLGFSVLTFGVVCCAALFLLHYRRKWLGGELGGPTGIKIQSFITFVGFWLGWVGLVSWRVLNWSDDAAFASKAFKVQGSCLFMTTVATVALMIPMRNYSKQMARERLAEAEAQSEAQSLTKVVSDEKETSKTSQEIAHPKDISQDVSTLSIFDVRLVKGEPTEVRV